MRERSFRLMMTLAMVWATTGALAVAQSETPVYSFGTFPPSAGDPYAGVIFDSVGNLYGTTTTANGAVFELSPESGGGWTETVLYTFAGGADGTNPQAGLVMDGAGNIYGTTDAGGAYGLGTAFELTPHAGGWTETVIHSFGNGTDGQSPQSSLILDAAGNLYGTAPKGGKYALGAVFELSQSGGNWSEKLLYSFGTNASVGANPNGPLVFDAQGNLYGTSLGGTSDRGTVFELMPGAHGLWSEKVLHTFIVGNGAVNPQTGVIFNSHGGLYGTAAGGGPGEGVVFELSHQHYGGWNESVIHTFQQNETDGRGPEGLIVEASGNLYGTTYVGGAGEFGTVYELRPTGNGDWTEKILHAFTLGDGDGAYPYGTLVIDSAGNLYGTALQGGTYENGLVYEITP